MRPIIGIDPSNWMPAFMPAFTRSATKDQVMAALADFEQLRVQEGYDGLWIYTMRPKEPRRYQGLSWLLLRLKSVPNTPDVQRLFNIELHFDRKIRFQPAFKQYLVHLCRLKYGSISSADERAETISIGSDSGGVLSLSSFDGEAEVSIQAPERPPRRRLVSHPAPAYNKVVPIRPADYAPPKGLPDVRRWLGIDPDHRHFTFLPRLTRSSSYDEVLAAFPDFRKLQDGRKRGMRIVVLVPKNPTTFPGIKKIELSFEARKGLQHQGLDAINVELISTPGKRQDLHRYLVKLLELNYGGGPKPVELSDDMTWWGDLGASASLHNFPNGPLNIRFGPYYY